MNEGPAAETELLGSAVQTMRSEDAAEGYVVWSQRHILISKVHTRACVGGGCRGRAREGESRTEQNIPLSNANVSVCVTDVCRSRVL